MAQLVAIGKAILQVVSLFKVIKTMYDKYQADKIHKHYEAKRKVVDDVTKKIEEEVAKPKEEQSDEELKELHRKLVNLGSSL